MTNLLPFAPLQERHAPEALDDPHRLARHLLHTVYLDPAGRVRLRYWGGEWWAWDGRRYRPLATDELTGQVTAGIKAEFDRQAHRRHENAVKVRRALVQDTLAALMSLVLVPGAVEAPVWLGDPAPSGPVIAMDNGLVYLDELLRPSAATLRPHTPEWFSPNCLPYPYEAGAPCPTWRRFLDDVLEGDAERMALLQEWFGYCLTSDTRMQTFLCGSRSSSRRLGTVGIQRSHPLRRRRPPP